MHATYTFRVDNDDFKKKIRKDSVKHLTQSMIYSAIERSDPEWCHFLHDEGFKSYLPLPGCREENLTKPLKLFAISDWIWVNKETVQLIVSSPVERTIRSIAKGLMDGAYLGEVELINIGIEFKRFGEVLKDTSNYCEFITLSPVTVYGRIEDVKKSQTDVKYNSPGDEFFEKALVNNLIRKFYAVKRYVLNEDMTKEDFLRLKNIRIFTEGPMKRHCNKYKQDIAENIISWSGKFKLKFEGIPSKDVKILSKQVVLDCGLGPRNSNGYGCLVPA